MRWTPTDSKTAINKKRRRRDAICATRSRPASIPGAEIVDRPMMVMCLRRSM